MIRKMTGNNRGFTLAETLVATLIMLMVSAILVAGIPAAKKAYDNVILRSNAEVLMSTATSALRNEVSVAKEIVKVEGTTIEYLSGTYGSGSKIMVDDEEGIEYQRYSNIYDVEDSNLYEGKDTNKNPGSESTPTRLVSKSASGNLIVKYNSIEGPDDGIITFHGLGIYKENGGDPIIPVKDLSILTFLGD